MFDLSVKVNFDASKYNLKKQILNSLDEAEASFDYKDGFMTSIDLVCEKILPAMAKNYKNLFSIHEKYNATKDPNEKQKLEEMFEYACEHLFDGNY